MALKFVDGFDHYNGLADLAARSGFCQYNGLNGSLVTGRNGNGKEFNGSFNASFAARNAKAGVGISTFISTVDVVWSLTDSIANAAQVSIVFRNRNFTIEAWRGAAGSGTQLSRSANNAFGANTQHFIEVWVQVDSSAGTIEVHVDGVQVLLLTGQNTQASGNTWWDALSVSAASYDDLYYCDTTTGAGTNPCNTFLGDPRVYTQFPTANSTVQFTPSANTNWQQVSEQAMDSDASYNSSSTVGQEDLFTIAPTPTTITGILALQVTGAYRKDDAGLRKMKSALKSSTTEVYGTQNSLPDTNYAYFSDVFPTDPATTASWTRAGVNAALIGNNLAA